jgi:hypothetical protein
MIQARTNITSQVIVQNVFIAFCAGVFTLETAFLFGDTKDNWLAVSAFFVTFGVYSILRKKDLNSHLIFIHTAITISFAAAFYMVVVCYLPVPVNEIQANSNLTLFFIFSALLVVILYYPKSVYRKINFEGLRQLTFGKPILIAYAWVMASAFVIATSRGEGFSYTFPLAEKFLFILALSIASDIVDTERDQSLRTIPVKYGIQVAKKIIVAILVVQITCVCFAEYESYQKIIICAASLISGFFIYKLHYGYKHSSILLVDGLIVLRSLPVVLLAL